MDMQNTGSMKWYLRLVSHPSDTPEDLKRKHYIQVFLIPGTVLPPFVLFYLGGVASPRDFFALGCALVCAVHVYCQLHLYILRRFTTRCVEVMAVFFALASILMDWSAAAAIGSFRMWPLFVILMDLVLLVGVSEAVTTGLVGLVVVWLAVLAVENSVPFGLYRVVAFPLDNRYMYIDCSEPPCPEPTTAVTDLICSLAIFLVDFHLTRRFSRLMRAEQERLRNAVAAGEKIAHCLARFDLDRAGELIASNPSAMSEVMETIMNNLRIYRPYLPESCFAHSGDESEVTSETSSHHRFTECRSSDASSTEVSLQIPIQVPCERRITVLVANMKDFLQVPGADMATTLDSYLTMLIQAAQETKGVIDGFNGDRVMVTFNGARHTMQHTVSAVRCGVTVLESSHHSLGRDVSVAVGSGMAHCGDYGCAAMKRYTCFGEVVGRVHLMERLHRRWGLEGVLCDRKAYDDSDVHFIFQRYPRRVDLAKVGEVNLYIALSTRSSVASEWMYQLEMSEERRFVVMNQAASLFIAGDVDRARAALDSLSKDITNYRVYDEVFASRATFVKVDEVAEHIS
eukprot:Sspe_Gene.73748::Locus_44794_Transcript_1_1_Confidence_1.000_Length_1823::g.73748::m.73748